MHSITLRTVDAARPFAVEPTSDPARASNDLGPCAVDGGPVERVLITTFGPAGVAAVAEEHPIAFDAVHCARCGNLERVFLSTEEVVALGNDGLRAASAGDLDAAEQHFRRITSSWTKYPMARLNLGAVYFDRIARAKRQGATAARVDALVNTAIEQLEQALGGEPPTVRQASLMLGRLHLLRGELDAARADVARVGTLGPIPPALSSAYEQLRAALQDGGVVRSAPRPSTPAPAAYDDDRYDARARAEAAGRDDGEEYDEDDEDDEYEDEDDARARPSNTVSNPYLALTMPPRFRRDEDAEEGYLAMFVSAGGELVNVVARELEAPLDVESMLPRFVESHEQSVRGNYPEVNAGPAIAFPGEAHLLDVRRKLDAANPRGRLGPERWTVFARYVLSREPIMRRDGRWVHLYLQLTHYGHDPIPPKDVLDALLAAKVLPMLGATEQPLESETLVPYLVTPTHVARRDAALASAGRAAEGARGLLPLGDELHVTVAIDRPEGAQPQFGADVRATTKEMLGALLARGADTIAAQLGGEELPVQSFRTTTFAIPPIWQPGVHAVVKDAPTRPLLVIGPSWMAASSVFSGELHRRARAALGEGPLRCLVPHRDRAFVYRASTVPGEDEALVAGILRAETELADRPIARAPFALEPYGLSPLGPAALEWLLLTTPAGASRAAIERRVPSGASARWAAGKPGTASDRDELRFVHPEAPSFTVRASFDGDRLFAIGVYGAVAGTLDDLAELDRQRAIAFPHLAFVDSSGAPFVLAKLLHTVEHPLSRRTGMGTSIAADVPGVGWLFGKVFGAGEDGRRTYGFDLRFQPGKQAPTREPPPR
jgi:hypothetical protein